MSRWPLKPTRDVVFLRRRLNDLWRSREILTPDTLPVVPRLDMLLVQREADLEGLLDGDEYVLPAGLVLFNGTVNLSDKAIRVSTGTTLRGLADAVIVSTNTSGVIRATNPESNTVIRELSVVCMTGPCLALTGGIDQQLNIFFCGFIGHSVGTITGWDVAAFKDCFVDAANGPVFTGTTNKTFVSQSVFYGVTGAAVQFAAGFTSKAVDIAGSYFKFDTANGIEAVTGYSVDRGIIRGCFFEGTLTPLEGFSEATREWQVSSSTGVRSSTTVGAFVQNGASETTTIAAADTPVKANLTTDPSDFLERFTHTNNRLTYVGDDDVTVTITIGGNLGATSPNQTVRLWATVNGATLDSAKGRAVLQGGGDVDYVAAFGIARMQKDDYVEIWVENLTSDADITMIDTSMMVARS